MTTPSGAGGDGGQAVAIRVTNLAKRYRVFSRPRDRLLQTLFGARRQYFREFHALGGVSFEVAHGRTVGIVGRNGSGKSTLLQIIAGTLTPTVGEVEIDGSVAALLELGSGFNPEFTGRENVHLNASILGLDAATLAERFDAIVAFADIGDFLDQPVKTYSSGMAVRLAFAVAISVDPRILIVDEALSVGDEAFQRKCFARIRQLKEGGATILFVSHSASAVVELCDEALLLDHGELLLRGDPKRVVALYQKLIYAPPDAVPTLREEIRGQGPQPAVKAGLVPQAPALAAAGGAGVLRPLFDPHLVPVSVVDYARQGAEICDVRIETPAGEGVNILVHGEQYAYVYRVRFDHTLQRVQFGMLVKTVSGLELGGGIYPSLQSCFPEIRAGQVAEVRFEFRCLVNPGTYFLNAGVQAEVDGRATYVHRVVDVAMFKVLPVSTPMATAWVNLDVTPSVSLQASCGSPVGGQTLSRVDE